MTPSRPVAMLDQARELREVLEVLAAALGRGDTAAVLAAEPALQAVVAAAGRAGAPGPDERAATAAELHRARTALARCRVLGAASAELTAVTQDVLGGAGAYSRHGAGQPRAPRGRDLLARV
ncbi:MAG: hypothetical protein JNL48_09730 [Acidobacteria bacterium]|nr:hypothetical protein [Acidobacteriota bacterium]